MSGATSLSPAGIQPKTTAAKPTIDAAQDPATFEKAGRKLAILKRSGLFGDDTRGATIERACTVDDLRKAYRLVHDIYLGTGYIQAEPAGLRLRLFETTSEMATFVAKVDGRVVGVLSVVADTPEMGLPSDTAFKKELDALRSQGLKVCEVTNQAVAADFRRSGVPTELIRCAIAHGIIAGYAEGVATVSPSHNGFYEMLGFREIGSVRSYSARIHDPVVALSIEIDRYRRPAGAIGEAQQFMDRFLAGENPYLARVGDWVKEARRHFFDPDLLHKLFVAERNFISECSQEELRILHRRWGHELFSAVTGDLFLPVIESVESVTPHPGVSKPVAVWPMGGYGMQKGVTARDNRISARNPRSSRSKIAQRARTRRAGSRKYNAISRR